MKTFYFVSAMMCVCSVNIYAQDLITTRDGRDINAKITEVSKNEIKYKLFDNLDGPTYIIATNELLMIRYENGTNEIYNQQEEKNDIIVANQNQEKVVNENTKNQTNYDVSGEIYPGMRYKDYKKLYIPSAYVPQPGDKYKPAVSGLCSFIIPGLGQMICGEVGRGFGYLGGAVGGLVLTGVGTGLAFVNPILGGTFIFIGATSWLVVDICAIVDGVRVAKIKNMYNQDINKLSSSINLQLTPYISSIGFAQTPVAGVSLSLTF